MAKTLTTESIPRRKKLDYWTKAVSETFVDLDCVTNSDRDFIDGSIEVRPLAGIQISRVKATEQKVSRRKTSIGVTPNDDWYLVSLQTRGSCVVAQGGRSARITSGGMALYDTQRPYSLELQTDFEQIVLQFSRDALERNVPAAESLTARGLSGASAASGVVYAAVQSLVSNIDALNSDAAIAMADGIGHLVFAGLHSLQDPEPEHHHELRRAAVKRYLSENLDDPTLSVKAVSDALHLSPSSIHRAFSHEGETLMGWVWNSRLERIHQELLRGLPPSMTLSQLALARGFSDAAHFSRAFRTRFGIAPSKVQSGR